MTDAAYPLSDDAFPGGGDVRALLRACDWASTPLGPPDAWPQSLRAAVRIMLTSRFAMWMAWGPELTFLCNDAYLPTVGLKRDWVIGSRSDKVWAEIWPDIGPRIERVLTGGEATWDEALPLYLERAGFIEETYHTFSYSPLANDQGATVGMLCVVAEVTERVLGERQLATLRDLGTRLASAATRAEVMKALEAALTAEPRDLPFALAYLADSDPAVLSARHGLAAEARAAPAALDADGFEAIWPLARARNGESVRVDVHPDSLGSFALAHWQSSPTSALIVPMRSADGGAPLGYLVAGLNPHRALDASYQGFIGLLTEQIAAAVARADEYERERQRLAALAEIDRAKTQFFSNVSHEFRTPLTLMLGPLEGALAPSSGLPLAQRERLDLAHRNAVRLLRLVNALLDFSRIEAGRVDARFRPTDLAALTAELASAFRAATEKAELALVVDTPALSQAVYVDRSMWETIVLNLLSNAFKFTFSGEIRVTLREQAAAAELVVSDTGTGIPAAELPRLFERFHRVEGAKGRSFEGSGIGLALVQELVAQHGGAISVDSEEGRGTRFSVTIPLGRAHLPPELVDAAVTPEAPTSRAQPFVEEALRWLPSDGQQANAALSDAMTLTPLQAHQAAAGETILVADDNADLRGYITRLLTERGYTVEAVSDGLAALAAARARRPNLIITDVMMPALDGFGLLAAIRADTGLRDIPVVMLSARAGEEATVEGLDAGADDYLVKPFAARELLARVASHLALARVRAEAAEAVRASEARASGVLDGMAEGFVLLDRDFRILDINREALNLERKSRDDIVGRLHWEVWPEVKGSSLGAALMRAMRDGTPVEMENHYVWPDGRDGWFEVRAYPAGDGLAMFYRDATDRKLAEARLRESEEQLRLATEAAEVGLWDVDEVNGALYWPPRVRAMFGIFADRPVSMADFYAGVHPDDREATSEAYAAAADPKRRAIYDVEYRTIGQEDGVVRWVAAKGQGIFDEDGRCRRVIGTAIDITRRKQAEQELRELNERLEQRIAEALAGRKVLADVVDGTDIFVQVADQEYNWLAVNKAAAREFARIFGVREPRAGDNMLAMLADHPGYQASVRRVWSRALAGEEFIEVDTFGDARVDRRYYEMRFRALRDAEGHVTGAYQFVSDVTDRLREQHRLQEAEAALAQAQKMEAVGQLTGGIAHDFNNLLQGVAGSLDLIRRKPGDRERVQRWADAGFKAAERGAKLTAQLLAFSRAQKIELRPVGLADLVSGFRDMLDRTIGPQVEVRLDLKTDGIRVLGDDVQIEMAVLNLALNARDAMPDGGTLTISTRPVRIEGDRELADGDYVELAVADTGAGMPPEVIARAFDPFFTTKGVGKGTGLGLSQAYGAMRQAGGTVRINSRVGHGTTVSLLLRRTDDEEGVAQAEANRSDHHSFSARILIVDDDADVRHFLIESLDALGFTVIEAEDGLAGLAALERTGADLMILDFAMPGLNGAEVAKRVQALRPNLPIIFATGFADSAALEAVAASTTPILRKPFGLDELQRVLNMALQGQSEATSLH